MRFLPPTADALRAQKPAAAAAATATAKEKKFKNP